MGTVEYSGYLTNLGKSGLLRGCQWRWILNAEKELRPEERRSRDLLGCHLKNRVLSLRMGWRVYFDVGIVDRCTWWSERVLLLQGASVTLQGEMGWPSPRLTLTTICSLGNGWKGGRSKEGRLFFSRFLSANMSRHYLGDLLIRWQRKVLKLRWKRRLWGAPGWPWSSAGLAERRRSNG